jgi:hypothetical protein
MSAEIIRFGKSGGVKTLSRPEWVNYILALGRPAAAVMSHVDVAKGARESIWREIHRIAGEAPEAWEPTEGEWIGDVTQIHDPAILKDLSGLAALAVAFDKRIAHLEDIDACRSARAAS